MPIGTDDDAGQIEVGASGVAELVWAIGALTWGERAGAMAGGDASASHAALADELRAFWASEAGDCSDGLDLVVLAHRVDAVLGDAVGAPLVERLLAAAATPPPDDLGLRSEKEADRAEAHARLAALAADPALRARYAELLVRVWDEVAAEAWERTGRARVARAVESWRGRVGDAEALVEALPPAHVMRRPRHAAVVAEALAAGGRVLFAPTYIGGAFNSYYELPGTLVVTYGIERARALVGIRDQAEGVASRLKPLTEATRLQLLAQLAATPMSVSELAEALELSQPTVSVHLQKLRDAGLVHARREGGRTVHRADVADVTRLLEEAGEAFKRFFDLGFG